MQRVAIYTRVSSKLQRETSVTDQEAVARRYAAARGWSVLDDHVYTDQAFSGATLVGRPAIQRLMAAAESHPRPFDVVLVDDSSRIARDLPDALRFLELMKFVGIQAIFISQNIDTTHEQSHTMVAIHGLVDSLYLKELGKKTRRGLEGQLERGFATGGATYGYRSVPDAALSSRIGADGKSKPVGWRREIVPDEAAVIIRIFEAYAAGTGITGVTEQLNEAGVPGPRNQPWRYGTVNRVLRNQRYCGRLIWGQRTFERRPNTRWKVARPQDRNAWHIKECPELRIVSEELWQRVQARIAEVNRLLRRQPGRNLLRGRQQARHLFTGVMRCGVCGGSMAIVAGGHGSPRYGCQQSWRHGTTTCANRFTIRAKVADPLLLSALQDRLTAPGTISYLTDVVSKEVARVLDARPERRPQLEAERSTTQRRLRNLAAAIEDDGPSTTVRQQIRDREAELARIEQELAAEPVALREKLTVLPSWVARQLGDVVDLLRDAPERTRTQFRRLGVSFMVSPVYNAERPYLRAVGSANVVDILLAEEFHFPATGHSCPRSAP